MGKIPYCGSLISTSRPAASHRSAHAAAAFIPTSPLSAKIVSASTPGIGSSVRIALAEPPSAGQFGVLDLCAVGLADAVPAVWTPRKVVQIALRDAPEWISQLAAAGAGRG